MTTVYLGLALGRVHRQRRLWTTLKVLLLTFFYWKLLSESVGIAVAAAIFQA